MFIRHFTQSVQGFNQSDRYTRLAQRENELVTTFADRFTTAYERMGETSRSRIVRTDFVEKLRPEIRAHMQSVYFAKGHNKIGDNSTSG